MAKQQTFIRDSQGRITQYHFKRAPSLRRIREIVHQAERQGAQKVGIVGDVGEFQGYEMLEGAPRQVRAFQGKSPQGLLSSLKGQGSNPGDYALLGALKDATGAEQVADLRGASINFYYYA